MILGFIGTTELLLIGGLALLLVGGKKLPEMMRGLGKGVREFKDGMKEDPAESQENNEQEAEKTTDSPQANEDQAPIESHEAPEHQEKNVASNS